MRYIRYTPEDTVSKRAPKKGTRPISGHDRHIAAIQAEKQRLENLTPVGTRRIVASFPPLRGVLDRLAWLVMATDPTAGRAIHPEHAYVTSTITSDGIAQAAATISQFVAIQRWANDELRALERRLTDAIDGGDFEKYRPEAPRCRKKDPQTGEKCSLFNLRQPHGTVTCGGSCGRPIDE